MAQPYVGEIRMFAGNFAPAGWALCEGQQMPISENETLFMLLGTSYGGDGQSTFGLPDLRGRVPIHMGQSGGTSTYALAESGGVEEVTVTVGQMPGHSHALMASSAFGTELSPRNRVLAQTQAIKLYNSAAPVAVRQLSTAISALGGSQPHENFQPYLCVNFIISLFGIFPTTT